MPAWNGLVNFINKCYFLFVILSSFIWHWQLIFFCSFDWPDGTSPQRTQITTLKQIIFSSFIHSLSLSHGIGGVIYLIGCAVQLDKMHVTCDLVCTLYCGSFFLLFHSGICAIWAFSCVKSTTLCLWWQSRGMTTVVTFFYRFTFFENELWWRDFFMWLNIS